MHHATTTEPATGAMPSARPGPRWATEPGWSYLLDIILLILGSVVLSVPLALTSHFIVLWLDHHPGFPQRVLAPIWNLWVLLGSVALSLPVLALVVRARHGWRLRDLIAPGRSPRWGASGRSALIWGPMAIVTIGVSAAIDHLSGEPWPVLPHFNAGRMVPFVLATIPLLGLQVATEEVVFRGYLDGVLRRWLRRPWLAAAGVALTFTALHTQSWGQAVWDQRLQYFLLSLFLTWISRRSGGLEAAIGLHFAQNFVVIYINGSLGDDYPSLLGMGAPDSKPADWSDIASVLLMMSALCGLYAWASGWVIGRQPAVQK